MDVILKVGGSIITDKTSEKPKEKLKNMLRIAREIKEGLKPNDRLILIHGVGSFGHPIVKKYGLQNGMKSNVQKVGFLYTQLQVDELNRMFCKILAKEGLSVAPINVGSSAVSENKELINLPTDVVEEALNKKMIPVLYGVPVHDKTQGSSIISGDKILSFLANKFKPDIIIHATDTDGIFTADPKIEPNARQIAKISGKRFEDIEKYLSGSTTIDVTGGMKEKIREVMSTETNAEIVNGTVSGILQRTLAGERGLGTTIEISDTVEVKIPILSAIGKRAGTRGAGFNLYMWLGKIFGLK